VEFFSVPAQAASRLAGKFGENYRSFYKTAGPGFKLLCVIEIRGKQ
jgi:hypothetical protein